VAFSSLAHPSRWTKIEAAVLIGSAQNFVSKSAAAIDLALAVGRPIAKQLTAFDAEPRSVVAPHQSLRGSNRAPLGVFNEHLFGLHE
jgi:hypothetical protein